MITLMTNKELWETESKMAEEHAVRVPSAGVQVHSQLVDVTQAQSKNELV